MVDLGKWFQRRGEVVQPEKLLYFPFPVIPDAVPFKTEKIEYDFTLTSSTCGVWLMRDAYAPFKHTFANIYCDRQRLMDSIVKLEDKSFKLYDWRWRSEKGLVTWGGIHSLKIVKAVTLSPPADCKTPMFQNSSNSPVWARL